MNRIKKNGLVFAAGIAASIAVHAAVIDFTAAEGYTNGVLEGQAGGAWSVENSDGFPGDSSYLVDASGSGTLSYTNNTSWVVAYYNDEALTNDVLSFEIDFSFTRADLTNGAANKQFYWPALVTDSHGSLSAWLGMDSTTNTFSFRATGNSGSRHNSPLATFSGTEIGLDDAGATNQSANLRMTLVASHNGVDNWNSTVMLYNIDTDSVVASNSWSWTGDGSWYAVDKTFRHSTAYIADLTAMTVEIDKTTLDQSPASTANSEVLASWDVWNGAVQGVKPSAINADSTRSGISAFAGTSVDPTYATIGGGIDAAYYGSMDGTFGDLSSPAADTTAWASNFRINMLQNNGNNRRLDFTLTNTTGSDVQLDAFYFDYNPSGSYQSNRPIEALEG
jgi:hypothetical protein